MIRTTLIWLLLCGIAQAQDGIRRIDITQYGILPSRQGISQALQSLINNQPDGTAFYVPRGVYFIDTPIRIDKELFTIEAEGMASGASVATVFAGNFAGPIFEFSDKCTAIVRGIGFRNRHANGNGIEFLDTNQQSEVADCAFTCNGKGLIVHNAKGFSSLRNYFHNCGIGAAIHGHSAIIGNQFIGNKEGLWLSHFGIYLYQMRCEANGVALRLGMDPDAKKSGFSNFDLSAIKFQANDTAIIVHGASNGSVGNFSLYGTTNAPNGASIAGVDILSGLNNVSWHNFDIHGGFKVGGLVVRSAALDALAEFRQAGIGNRQGGVNNSDLAWRAEVDGQLVRLNPAHMPNAVFQQCNLDQSHPIVVDLVNPKGIVNTRTPTFEWNPIEGAQSYQLRVYQKIAGSRPPVFSKSFLPTPNFTSPIALERGLTYNWQVRVQMTDGTWSDWRAALFNVSAMAE